jgi:hypothetical protein
VRVTLTLFNSRSFLRIIHQKNEKKTCPMNGKGFTANRRHREREASQATTTVHISTCRVESWESAFAIAAKRLSLYNKA